MGSNIMWVKIDIDGDGKRWLLAVKVEEEILFPTEDFDFGIWELDGCEIIPIEPPQSSEKGMVFKYD